jgi:DNA-binding CsgD family transcriptional regulator
MELKNKLLTSLAHNMTQKNELIDQLQEELTKQQDKNISKKKMVSSAIDNLKKSSAQQEWHEFQKEFDLVYEGFIEKLIKTYPDLTRQELKTCALLKLGFSTKEIANVLYITPKSVSNHRHRIRKKINLSSETDLNLFFMNL